MGKGAGRGGLSGYFLKLDWKLGLSFYGVVSISFE